MAIQVSKKSPKPELVTIHPKWTDKQARMYVRSGGSDTGVIEEVITRRCYRKPSIGLEIEVGEYWLDLGANIGTFAVCCFLHGATAACYEPVESCFKLLKKNVPWKGFKLVQSAITAKKEKTLPAWESKNPLNFYRTTIVPTNAYQQCPDIPNIYAGTLIGDYDGVKMDIEGSELELIDKGLIPDAEKLALEYHFSRDNKDMKNFHRRMGILRDLYKVVSYAPSLDKTKTGQYPGRFDIIVHCIGKK